MFYRMNVRRRQLPLFLMAIFLLPSSHLFECIIFTCFPQWQSSSTRNNIFHHALGLLTSFITISCCIIRFYCPPCLPTTHLLLLFALHAYYPKRKKSIFLHFFPASLLYFAFLRLWCCYPVFRCLVSRNH